MPDVVFLGAGSGTDCSSCFLRFVGLSSGVAGIVSTDVPAGLRIGLKSLQALTFNNGLISKRRHP